MTTLNQLDGVVLQGEPANPIQTGILRSVASTPSQQIEDNPLGFSSDIIYSALVNRLTEALTEDTNLHTIVARSLVGQIVNFQALAVQPTVGIRPNRSDGTGADADSNVWSRNKSSVLPTTSMLPMTETTLTALNGPDRQVMVVKMLADVGQHLPCVLLNITRREAKPVGIGGNALTGRRYDQRGNAVSEYTYLADVDVELTILTGDESSTAALQACVEAVFGTYRDLGGATGAKISGRRWSVTLSASVPQTAPILELDRPWSQNDGKTSKMYSTTVTLADISFECTANIIHESASLASFVSKQAAPTLSAVGLRDTTLSLQIGQRTVLTINGMIVGDTPRLSLQSKTRRPPVRIETPSQTRSGKYEIVAMAEGTVELQIVRQGTLAWSALSAGFDSNRDKTAEVVSTIRVNVLV